VVDACTRGRGGRCGIEDAVIVGSAFLDSFPFIADHLGLLLRQTVNHLELSGAAVALACLVAMPIGLVLGHIHRGNFVVISVANVVRALPTLAVIAILLVIVGIGFRNVVIALFVLAVPPILTHTYVAIDRADRDAVEAARGMGLKERQILLRVELPLALPLIFAGFRTAVVFVISTAPLAALAGGEGLGVIIVNEPSYKLSGIIAATYWVAGLAIAAELVAAAIQRALTPAPLRRVRHVDPAVSGAAADFELADPASGAA
jgi:osmoprotectant transport system permease protein